MRSKKDFKKGEINCTFDFNSSVILKDSLKTEAQFGIYAKDGV